MMTRSKFAGVFALALPMALVSTACKTPMRVIGPGKSQMQSHALGYTGATAVFVQVKDDQNHVRRCLLPPAQAGVEIDVTGKLSVKDTVAGEVGVDDKLSSLYDQTETSLFIQLLAYRYCEVYINGGMASTGYAEAITNLTRLAALLAMAEITRAAAGGNQTATDEDVQRVMDAIVAEQALSASATDVQKQAARDTVRGAIRQAAKAHGGGVAPSAEDLAKILGSFVVPTDGAPVTRGAAAGGPD